jgi:hypothetical protein
MCFYRESFDIPMDKILRVVYWTLLSYGYETKLMLLTVHVRPRVVTFQFHKFRLYLNNIHESKLVYSALNNTTFSLS